MVAIVTGNSLGLSLTSQATLGPDGSAGSSRIGQGGEQAFVNLANGNLVLQTRDDHFASAGSDIDIVRTYNSQGQMQDAWRVGVERQRVVPADEGAGLWRTDFDGAAALHAWDESLQAYVSDDGAGAYDTIRIVSGRYEWIDGATGLVERYEVEGGRLIESEDSDGHVTAYGYAGDAPGRLATVTSASGDVVRYDYDGAGRLAGIATTLVTGGTVSRIAYDYDAQDRLSSVTVDLTPEDGSDSKTYTTAYTYDGHSHRLASVSQSDGTSLAFTYVLEGGRHRVQTIRDGLNHVTSYSYDTAAGRTTMIDPVGVVTVFQYDGEGRLLTVASGSVAETDAVLTTTLTTTPVDGIAVSTLTDAQGRTLLGWDAPAAGTTVTWRYRPAGEGPWTSVSTSTGANNTCTVALPTGVAGDFEYELLHTPSGSNWPVARALGTFTVAVTQAAHEEVRTFAVNPVSVSVVAGSANGQSRMEWAAPAGGITSTWRYRLPGGEWLALPVTTSDGTQFVALTALAPDDYEFELVQTDVAGSPVAHAVGTLEVHSTSASYYVADPATHPVVAETSASGAPQLRWSSPAAGAGTTARYRNASGVWVNLAVSTDGASGVQTASLAGLAPGSYQYEVAPAGEPATVLRGTVQILATVAQHTETRPVAVSVLAVTNNGGINWPQGASGISSQLRYRTSSTGTWVTYNGSISTSNGVRTISVGNLPERYKWVEFEVIHTDASGTPVAHGTGLYYTTGSGTPQLKLGQAAFGEGSQGLITGPTPTTRLMSVTVPAATPAEPMNATPVASLDSANLPRLSWDAPPAGTTSTFRYRVGSTWTSIPVTTTASTQSVSLAALPAGDYEYAIEHTGASSLRTTGTVRVFAPVPTQTSTQQVPVATIPVTASYSDGIGWPVGTNGATTTFRYRTSPTGSWQTYTNSFSYADGMKRIPRGNIPGRNAWCEFEILLTPAGSTVPTAHAVGRYFYDGRDNTLTVQLGEIGIVNGAFAVVGPTPATRAAQVTVAGYTPAPVLAVTPVIVDTSPIPLPTATLSTPTTRDAMVAVPDVLGVTSSSHTLANSAQLELQYWSGDAGASGLHQLRSFTYNARGDVEAIVDGAGQVTAFTYDSRGNQLTQRDAAGNTVHRTYNSANRVTAETAYRAPDPDGAGAGQPSGAMSAHYFYEAGGTRLRFAVSSEGRVTEYQYNALGQRRAEIAYAGAAYGGALTLDGLRAWTAGQGPAQAVSTTFTYDARGQLKTAAGAVDMAYEYDPFGRLIETRDGNGNVTKYFHDGLGRLYEVRNALGEVTHTDFDDAGRAIRTTMANGLVTTQFLDRAGRLLARVDSGGGDANLGTTTYAYDDANRLVMTTDPTLVRTFVLYDAQGRKSAEVDGNGTLTEYRYDAANRVTRTIRYAAAVPMSALVDGAGKPRLPAVDAIRPAGASISSWSAYDAAGRLAKTVDAEGAVVEYRYDGASRRLETRLYARRLESLSTLGDAPEASAISPGASEDDRITRYFHDDDGLLVGTLDAEGYLVALAYDGAGRLQKQTAYAGETALAKRPDGTLDELVASIAAHDPDGDGVGNDRITWFLRDARGLVSREVDAEGAITDKDYDDAGNLVRVTRYAAVLTPAQMASLDSAAELAAFTPSAAGAQVTQYSYDELNRIDTETDFHGTVTKYEYDAAGNLTRTRRGLAGDEAARTIARRFDLQGRLADELSAEGGALLTGNAANDAAVWQQHAIHHSYDHAGRRTSTTDQNGNRTVFYYNADGQLTHTIRLLTVDGTLQGEVTENRYDGLGRMTETVRYAKRIAGAGLDGGRASPPAVPTSAQDERTSYRHSDTGRIDRVTDALGFRTHYVFNAFGEQTSRTRDITSTTTVADRFTYDRRGLLKETVADVGGIAATTKQTYDAFGRVNTETDANGNTRDFHLDRMGRQIRIVDGRDKVSSTTYDAFGRVWTETDALGFVTTYSYDDAARSMTVSTDLKDGRQVEVVTWFDELGQTVKVRDGEKFHTKYSYDRDGRLALVQKQVSIANGDTGVYVDVERNTYDDAGLLYETQDGNLNVVRFAYDGANRLVTRTVDPGAGRLNLVTQYQYDAKGQQFKVIDPAQTETLFEYDANGRLLRRTEDWDTAEGKLNLLTQFAYDGLGRTVTVTSPANAVTVYTFDKLGRREKESLALADGTKVERGWVYDDAGNVVASIDGTNNKTRYVYDADNRLVYTVNALGEVESRTYDDAGQLIETRRHAGRVSVAGLPDRLQLASFAPMAPKSETLDAVEHRVLDGVGRLAASVTVLSTGRYAVVSYTYDGTGRVIGRRGYVAEASSFTPRVMPAVAANDAEDEHVRTVYDGLGRALYTMDGARGIVAFKYDANGNVIERIAYATAAPVGTGATQAAISGAVSMGGFAKPALDRRMRYTYDAANRLLRSADGLGALTSREYDKAGNVVKLTRHYKEVGYTTDLRAYTPAPNAQDRVTQHLFDATGRCIYSIDEMLGVVRFGYDAEGRVTERRAFANELANATGWSKATLDALASADDRITAHVYDKAGREVFVMDPTGAVTGKVYDGAGRVTSSTAYATKVASASGIAAMAQQANADNRVTRNTYDAAGRLEYTVDAGRYVKGHAYDALGRLGSTTLYETAIALPPNPTADDIRAKAAEAAFLAAAGNRTDSFGYDRAGRMTSSTDALGHTERFTYDGLGRKETFTNKLQATWTYEYDAAGRLRKEISPQLAYSWLQPSQEAATATGALETRLDYDALGQLVARTEAANIAGQERVTKYEYDAAGRQVRTVYPGSFAYNYATGSEEAVELFTQTVYDIFGDAVRGVDLAGNSSYKLYDKAGRLAYEVDPLGHVTRYTRGDFGEVKDLTRLATAYAATASTTRSELDGIAANARDRTITTTYDKAGRVQTVQEPAVYAYDTAPDTPVSYLSVRKTTTHTYNTFGDLIKTSDGRALTSYFYDERGLQEATVDALGYITVQAFNADGTVKSRTEYATALNTGAWNADTGTYPATPAPSQKDRRTEFYYDKLGRKIEERRIAVEASTNAGTIQAAEQKVRLTGTRPATTFSVTGAGYALVTGAGVTTLSNGTTLVQWDPPAWPYKSTVRFRRAGQDWQDATVIVENGKHRFYLSGDTDPGAYEVEASWVGESVSQSGGVEQGNVDYTTYYYAVNRSIFNLDVKAPVIAAADETTLSGNPGALGLQAAYGDGAWRWEWNTPPAGQVAVFEYQRPGSANWETAVATTSAGKQFVRIPPDMPLGDHKVRLRLQWAFAHNAETASTHFGYDDVGNLLGTMDALGNVTLHQYDALGRLTTTVSPSGENQGAVTEYLRDVHGNAVAQRSLATRVTLDANYNFTRTADAARDRVELSLFDRFGHVRVRKDAEGVLNYFSYSRRGDLAQSWYYAGSGTSEQLVSRAMIYDKAGRVTAIIERAPAAIDGTTSGHAGINMQYNAFGELEKRWADGVSGFEYWEYDNAGRVLRTNEGDGVHRAMLHDVQGNATLEVRNNAVEKTFTVEGLTEQQLVQSSLGTRTYMRYDKLGRATERLLPDRTVQQGGVSSFRMNGTVAIEQQGSLGYEDNNTGWYGPLKWLASNRVRIAWAADLTSLGSGDVKVVLNYTTVAQTITDGNGETVHVPAGSSSISRLFLSEEAALGVVVDWTENDTGRGGIGAVTSYKVYKKDLFGQWQEFGSDQILPGGYNVITAAAPENPLTEVKLEIRRAGSPAGTAWELCTTHSFGNQLVFNPNGLIDGTYEYRMLAKQSNDAAFGVVAAGVVELDRPALNVLSPMTQPTGGTIGVYSWKRATDGSTDVLRYRLSGTSNVWQEAPLGSAPGDLLNFDSRAFANGTYEYEIVRLQALDKRPVGHVTGTFTVVAGLGAEPILNIGFQTATPGSAVFEWDRPADDITVKLEYRLKTASTFTAGQVNNDGPRQTGRVPAGTATLAPGDYVTRLSFYRGAQMIGMTEGDLNVAAAPATPTLANVPGVSGLTLTALTEGDWRIQLSKASTSTVEALVRWEGGSEWVSASHILDPSGALGAGLTSINRTIDSTAFTKGKYELHVFVKDVNGTVTHSSLRVLDIRSQDLMVQTTDTTPRGLGYPGIEATFNASDRSFTWPKSTVTTESTRIAYRPKGSNGPWVTKSYTTLTSAYKASFGVSELTEGDWEIDISYYQGTTRTAQTLRTMAIGPSSGVQALVFDANPAASGLPAVPELGWGADAANGGSVLTWKKPPSGTNAFIRMRSRSDGGAWIMLDHTNFGTNAEQTGQWYTIKPASAAGGYAPGTWDIELMWMDTANNNAITTYSAGSLVVAADGWTHTMAPAALPAVGALPGIGFALNSADSGWTVTWDKPGMGESDKFRYRLVGTETWTYVTPVTDAITNQRKVAIAHTALAAGRYEVEVYLHNSTTPTVFKKYNAAVVAHRPPLARDTSLPYTPPRVPGAEVVRWADGSFQLRWIKPAGGVQDTVQYGPQGTALQTWPSAAIAETTLGGVVYRYIEVPDNLATGLHELKITLTQGSRVTAQWSNTVTVLEDSMTPVFPSMPAIPVNIVPNGSNGYKFTWAKPASGTTEAYTRVAGGTWVRANIGTPDASGNYSVALPWDAAANWEIDVRYVASSSLRTAQTWARIAIPAPVAGATQPVGTPRFDPNYSAPKHSTLADAVQTANARHAFTASGTPQGLGTFTFTTPADGTSVLEWTKPATGITTNVRYRVQGTSTWREDIEVITEGTRQRFVAPSGTLPGQYEIEIYLSSGGGVTGVLTRPGTWDIWQLANGSNGADFFSQARTYSTYDRWGNLLSATDARNRNWITRYEYNANNQMVRQTQAAAAHVTASGDEEIASAVTHIYYDKLGRQLAVQDANGNVAEQYWDDAGQVYARFHADGGQTWDYYDAFGDKTRTDVKVDDSDWRRTEYTYDRLSRLVTTTHEAESAVSFDANWTFASTVGQLVETNGYDQGGRKTSASNNAGDAAASYGYDARGNVISATVAGVTTRYAWDTLGRKIEERDGKGGVATWSYDYFGRVLTHTDLGGAVHTYSYAAGLLVEETSTKGGVRQKDRDYSYDRLGQLVRIEDVIRYPAEGSTPAAGYKQVTTYAYDLAGLRVRERTTQETLLAAGVRAVTYQDNHMAYDALGRLMWVADGRAKVTIDYDRVGNRRRIRTQVIAGTETELTSTDRWFAYDQMNRQVLADVQKDASLGANGHRIDYDLAGDKISDTWVGAKVETTPGGLRTFTVYGDSGETLNSYWVDTSYKAITGETTEKYGRDALGRIRTIERDGQIVDSRYYDRAGRLVQSGGVGLAQEYLQALNGVNSKGTVLQGNGTEVRKSRYNSLGQMTHQEVRATNNGAYLYGLSFDANDAAGNATGYEMRQGSKTYDYTYTNTAIGESYKQTVTEAREGGNTGRTTSHYDANGYLIRVDDDKQDANDRTIVNDASGKVLYMKQAGHIQRQLVVNGEVMGRYGEAVDADEPRSEAGVPVFETVSDFGFGFTAQGGNTPVVQDRSHTVGAGDSLQSLAQMYYGDSRLWYRIAEANGLAGNQDLRAGQALKIAATEASGNASGTFKPYNPSDIVGDTTPYVPQPKKKSNFFKQLIVAIVAVVASVFLGPQMLMLMEGLMGAGVAATVSAAVATAAVASVASQAVGVAIGAQEKFSWKQVGLSAVSAGVTQGMGASAIVNTGSSVGNAMVNGAVNNMATQGIGVATGLQSRFSWKAVAASSLGAGVGVGVNEALAGGFNTVVDPTGMNNAMHAPANPVFGSFGTGGEQFARAAVSTFGASTAAALARGGKVAVQQVAVDAFGNALGTSLVDAALEATRDSVANHHLDGHSTSIEPAHRNRSDVEGGHAQTRNEFVDAMNRFSEEGIDDYEELDLAALSDRNGLGLRFDPVRAAVAGTGLKAGGGMGLSASNAEIGLRPSAGRALPATSIFDLGSRFVSGAFYGAVNMFWQPMAQTLDLGQAGVGLLTGGKYDPYWLSDISRNYAAGMSYGETVGRAALSSNPVTGLGLAGYDLIGSAMRGDWGGVAEGLGGMVGSYGLVKGGQRYFAPEPGAQLGIYRVRPEVGMTDPLVSPGRLLRALPPDQAPNFIDAKPVFLGGRSLTRAFDTLDLDQPRGAKPNGSYWSERAYRTEADWRSGTAVPQRANWNKGTLQAEWTPDGGWGWGGKAASQAIPAFSIDKWGFKVGWIQRGRDYQIWVPDSRSVIPMSGIKIRSTPWSK